MKYPIRCEIIDVVGHNYRVGPFLADTPEKSKPHIGKQGIAEKINGDVKITLDDGNILYGWGCWWKPTDYR